MLFTLKIPVVPEVIKLPPVILAALVIVLVADINPAVNTLPPVTLPVADTIPPVNTLPPVMFPVMFPVVALRVDMYEVWK